MLDKGYVASSLENGFFLVLIETLKIIINCILKRKSEFYLQNFV